MPAGKRKTLARVFMSHGTLPAERRMTRLTIQAELIGAVTGVTRCQVFFQMTAGTFGGYTGEFVLIFLFMAIAAGCHSVPARQRKACLRVHGNNIERFPA